MDSTQFAWLYMVEHGKAGVRSSYYGGYDACDKQSQGMVKRDIVYQEDVEAIRAAYLAAVKRVGVDWKKTCSPDSDIVSSFAGTFAEEHDRKEVLKGKLFLKNGVVQTWEADALEVSNVFVMMAEADAAKERFKKVFGEK